ncbi:MAG TPA: FecR domain-containing protein [Kofleriaceae bacterium]|nr:FecR domain-containing protein [Kofleriaceae bacterium]
MRTTHEEVLDDLAALVAGDSEAIARHADHLSSCDDCRDKKHEAAVTAKLVGDAGADYVPNASLVDALMAKVDADKTAGSAETIQMEAAPVVLPKASQPEITTAKPAAPVAKVASIEAKREQKRQAPSKKLYAAAAIAALAAGTTGIIAIKHRASSSSSTQTATREGGPLGTVKTISRAAADQGDGLAMKTSSGWKALKPGDVIPAGAELRTDERTRASIEITGGDMRLVLDHATTVAFDANSARKLKLPSGRIAADVVHDDKHPMSITTPNGVVDDVGTRFSVTATDKVTAVQVVRGEVKLTSKDGASDAVRAGEEGLIENGKLSVNAAPSLVKENQWSELAPPPAKDSDDSLAGLGALRAYKPGEKRDRDWKLALANHEVKVRIVGPIARTEITETFRNDSDTTLEGVYQFPLPADAQIDSLALDMKDEPGGFIAGAFVDKDRATKIWKGVIDKATPKHIQRDPLIMQEIVWVPGPWKDPALLDWKRGGRFELKIYPIPAKGARTIKLSYTQVVTPRGPMRQYVYPLPHSFDGSTVADKMKVDVEVRGAQQGSVRTVGYDFKADAARNDVTAMTFEQGGFVPRGDLVVDYRSEQGDAELRAWTFQGGAAAGPDDKLAGKKNVGIDPKVVEAQKLVAADARPTAVIALSPKLPRWRESKPRDYVIVIDGSQSMVGERFAKASELAAAMVDDMDRRDRFSALVCDSECTRMGDLRTPSAGAAGDLKSWLGAQQPAGSSDVVTALRAGNDELKDADRDRWVLYIGDGFASSGFRRVSDVEKAIAATTGNGSVHISTIGLGSDADSALLAAAARGGGGSYVAWLPGETVHTAALAALESTNGTTLRDAVVELPAGMSEVAAQGGAPGETTTATKLPTLRAGGELLISARIDGNVTGEVVLKGKVAGQKFEQRYPVKLEVSSAPGNGFVPRLWASLAIDQLEREGKGEDRARVVALSQGYGVMSRQTSLLVLESQAMFDAFGVDRSQSAVTWTGEEDIEESTSAGSLQVPADIGGGKAAAAPQPAAMRKADSMAGDDAESARGMMGGAASIRDEKKAPAMDKPAAQTAMPRMPNRGRRITIAMKKVWTRNAALGSFSGTDASIKKAVATAEDALAKNPDSREKHRALVQALSYAGDLDKAHEIANRWLERDKLDPQALTYIADLLGRDGKRELSLRTLDGLVDLDPDRANLHERMINAFERSGRMQQACNHRIAMVSLNVKEAAKRAAAAARCLRTLGRGSDAELVMKSLVDDKARTEAEKLATVAPISPRVAGDLVINGKWDGSADLDISLVAPDGSRVSWMGGRTDITVADSTAHDREQLSVKTLRKGNYLIEITRSESTTSPVHGTIDVTVLGQKKAFPFELSGSRTTVGKISVTMTSHLEPVNPDDARWLNQGRGWDGGL